MLEVVQQAPKHQLADPALAARLLGLSATTLATPPRRCDGRAVVRVLGHADRESGSPGGAGQGRCGCADCSVRRWSMLS